MTETKDFIRKIVEEDLASGRIKRVHTRFPPEPNGYLHIGHAKAIVLNFELAKETGGLCNLRFDDTNPAKEETRFVEAIKEDIRWLGYDWGDREYYASDYFEQLYQWAEELIKKGKAYVCDLSPEEIRRYRGTLTEPGKESPYRNRSVEENLDLFRRMRKGEFPEGSKTLRAKIDMASPNLNMRDPVMYRIMYRSHHRTGDKWCIYPTYDWAHGQSDAIEGITHSLCTLEFEDHRPLYDWFLEQLEINPRPRQIEFARLNLSYTVLSKRHLARLVKERVVDGWDDPRMPTISGLRRRGYTPEAIKSFCKRIGLAKRDSVVDIALLEWAVRDHLNQTAPRVMAVLDPVKLIVENYPEEGYEELDAPYYPDDPPRMGYRKVPFCRELYIERSDFMIDPPKKFWRLAPGKEVRLRWAYIVKCTGYETDPNTGEVTEIRCVYYPETRGGAAPAGRKIKGTIHWVSARHAVEAQVRLYDRLFKVPEPGAGGVDLMEHLNPESLVILEGCKLEPVLGEAKPGDRFQFERKGYFCVDTKYSAPGRPVFNRTVPLKDTWARIQARLEGSGK